MLSKTMEQHNAMEAAAHGNSKLGIPEKVGEEYVEKDKKAKKKFSPGKAKAVSAALRSAGSPEEPPAM